MTAKLKKKGMWIKSIEHTKKRIVERITFGLSSYLGQSAQIVLNTVVIKEKKIFY